VISVIGIRRAESPARRLTPISAADPRLTDSAGTSGLVWHPLERFPISLHRILSL